MNITMKEMIAAPSDTYWLIKSDAKPDLPPHLSRHIYQHTQLYRKLKCFHLVAHKTRYNTIDINTVNGKVDGKPDGNWRWSKKMESHFYYELFSPHPYQTNIIEKIDKKNLEKTLKTMEEMQ